MINALSLHDALPISTAVFVLRMVSTHSVASATKLKTNSLFIFPPENDCYCFLDSPKSNRVRRVSGPWFEHKYRGLFVIMSWRREDRKSTRLNSSHRT